MQVTILAISKKERITKNGPIMGVSIKTKEYGEKWLSGWEDGINEEWKKGDVVEVTVTKNGDFLNYKTVKSSVEPDEVQPEVVSVEDNPITEGIEKRHGERQDGMALGNAKTNACNITVALINKGLVTNIETAEKYITRLTEYIFLVK